ncbi:hypothetical protein HNQ73_003104 [Chelatococcus composti]|uniref:Uncharacterized protein n=1 Tax=Chelatococcus composti TaxID=1743235 RepID=A0A841KDM7_9HYPH|nr:hypothetical protein [Chelatococcus composti]
MREHHAPSPEEAGAETRSAPAKLAGGGREEPKDAAHLRARAGRRATDQKTTA